MWNYKALDIRDGGKSVVVDTRGLRRIIAEPDGEVLYELVPLMHVEHYLKSCILAPGRTEVVQSYQQAYARTHGKRKRRVAKAK
jgi:hypothetical protein